MRKMHAHTMFVMLIAQSADQWNCMFIADTWPTTAITIPTMYRPFMFLMLTKWPYRMSRLSLYIIQANFR